MAQGAEADLLDVIFFTEDRAVYYIGDNVVFERLNSNVLTVDNKAILAKNTALTVEADLAAHVGSVGTLVHDVVTTSTSGFMSAADKAKLDDIQYGAQAGILSPQDALELTARKDTLLHLHPEATTTSNGFMSAADKIKLDGIENGAQANRLTDPQALNLTDGSNADSLHIHFFAVATEQFTATYHDNSISHAGIPGTSGFTPFVTTESFFEGPIINSGSGTVVSIFTHTYPFEPQTLAGGISYLYSTGYDNKNEHLISDFEVSGNDGIITYSAVDPGNATAVYLRCWQGGYGNP